ncbi:T9SS type A sorting domain-containing protein [Porphyromonas endodontalis]|uniref:T9SS type A sorting domain-containing protein n=1 Tax=Porphyromonas endodontalis TaxID=28124 RepID=UPI003F9EE625
MKGNTPLLVKALLAPILVASSTLFATAQISYGGTPASFNHSASSSALRSVAAPKVIKVLPNFNPDDVKSTNGWDVNRLHVKPLTIGRTIETNIDFARDAERITLDNGTTMYRLTIDVKNAKASLLYYDDFFIPKNGGELYIYTPDRLKVLGKYTHETHPTHGAFATEMLPGATAVLEYYPYLNSQEMPSILISSVGHIFSTREAGLRDPGEDGAHDDCAFNVNAAEGAEWQEQKAGVVQIMMVHGRNISVCSGNLLNNTNEDFKPYILSAAHCESVTKNRNSSDADLAQWIFTFHYEKPNSSNGAIAIVREQAKSMVGCDIRAFLPIDGQSDGLLLELKQEVPESYRVYYNGWDRSDVLPNSGVGMHHPAGDAKKISVYNGGVTSKTWDDRYNGQGCRGAENAHLFFHFTKGETEGGSSGSSLWNENKLVVGTLTGGGGRCTTGTNYYGKLSYHWDKFSEKMSTFLDPKTNGTATSLPGVWRKNKDGVELRPLPNVTGLKIEKDGDNLKVSWDAIPSTYLAPGWKVKYNIRRNNSTAEYKRTEATSFSEPAIDAEKANRDEKGFCQTITYAVQARYEYGTGNDLTTLDPTKPERYVETDWAEQSIFVGERSKWVPVVSKSQESSGGMRISWNLPYNFQEITLFGAPKSDAEYKPTYARMKVSFGGFPVPQDITLFSKFPSDALRSNDKPVYVHGLRLMPTSAGSSYKAFLQTSKSRSSIVTKPFSVPSTWKMGEWVTVMFDKPILINHEKVLFAGVSVTNAAGADLLCYYNYSNDAYRQYTDGFFAFDLRETDLFYMSPSQTSTIYTVVPSGYLAIGLLLSTNNKKSSPEDNLGIFSTSKQLAPFPVVKEFIVKRNGQEIARVNTREYTDKDGKESDKYDIEVAYEEGVYTGNQEIPYEKEAPGVYPTKIGNDALLHLTSSSSISAVSIYTVDGVLLKKVERPSASISVEDLASGNSYIVVLDGNTGRSVHRIFR